MDQLVTLDAEVTVLNEDLSNILWQELHILKGQKQTPPKKRKSTKMTNNDYFYICNSKPIFNKIA